MSTTTRPVPRFPNWADEYVVGRAAPRESLQARQHRTHATGVALFRALEAFWLDVAAAHLDLAESGCRDALWDAREALGFADYYGQGRAA